MMSKTLINSAFGPYPGDMMSKVAGPSFSLAKFSPCPIQFWSSGGILSFPTLICFAPGFEDVEAAELIAVAFADVVVYQRRFPWVNVV